MKHYVIYFWTAVCAPDMDFNICALLREGCSGLNFVSSNCVGRKRLSSVSVILKQRSQYIADNIAINAGGQEPHITRLAVVVSVNTHTHCICWGGGTSWRYCDIITQYAPYKCL